MVTAADSMKEGVAGFDIELNCGYPRAILAAVVLFFHEQIQLVQPVEDGTILLKVVRERFS